MGAEITGQNRAVGCLWTTEFRAGREWFGQAGGPAGGRDPRHTALPWRPGPRYCLRNSVVTDQ
ncbi:hypothetical protein GCM10010350_26010 [Streptomyces galilaeus]|nr:hypothetical protein GCM10010350_26010 [Streptomyces galilaeus]